MINYVSARQNLVWSAARCLHGSSSRSGANLLGVYCVGGDADHPAKVGEVLSRLGFDVPVHHFLAVDGFDKELQDSVLQHVNNRLVEPAALPPILVRAEWRRQWRAEKKWHHVRRSREAPGRKHGGWLFDLDLTRGALGHALSHLQLWEEIAKKHMQCQGKKQGASEEVYLVLDENCNFLPTFCKSYLDDRLEDVSPDWDLVFLGGSDLLGAQTQHQVSPGVLRLYPWFRAGPAYLLRASAADRVFKHCTPLRWRLDCHLAGYDSSKRLDVSAEERIFGPTRKPIGYSFIPSLVEEIVPKRFQDSHRKSYNHLEKYSESATVVANEQRWMDELDAIIAWTMRLTDRPLRPGSIESIWHPDREIEGHTNMVPEAMSVINELAADANVQTICEIGFNGGHSTLRWLLRSHARIYSFDLGTHHYARPAAMWLMKKFPGRLTVIWGDSLAEVPKFLEANPRIKCDIISIDGGHDYHAAKKDLEHLASAANLPHNRILMDDVFLHEVRHAWDEMIHAGYVEELQTYAGTLENGLSYGFAVGRYTGRSAD